LVQKGKHHKTRGKRYRNKKKEGIVARVSFSFVGHGYEGLEVLGNNG